VTLLGCGGSSAPKVVPDPPGAKKADVNNPMSGLTDPTNTSPETAAAGSLVPGAAAPGGTAPGATPPAEGSK
jgi:hypothetical protein